MRTVKVGTSIFANIRTLHWSITHDHDGAHTLMDFTNAIRLVTARMTTMV